MTDSVFLVSPVAPAGSAATAAPQAGSGTRASGKALRLGLLDNGKFNAAELLAGIARGLQARLPVAAVVQERKYSMSSPAGDAALDRLARQADVVISAMAD